jgi:glycogen debranching enzyme
MRHDSPGHAWLIERYRRLGYDAQKITERYDEHVEDVLVNVCYALSLRALARLDSERRELHEHRAATTERALLERCYDEQTGLFFDLAGRAERQVRVSTWSSLAPLALPSLPEHVRRRLVEQHLLHPGRYNAPFGIPSVSREEPSFKPGFALWRCWRGPSWVNTAWLLVPPMRELGYGVDAKRIVDSLRLAVSRNGFREYYNPLTGAGLGARRFGFATLLIDLLPGHPVAANSGLANSDPSAAHPMIQP